LVNIVFFLLMKKEVFNLTQTRVLVHTLHVLDLLTMITLLIVLVPNCISSSSSDDPCTIHVWSYGGERAWICKVNIILPKVKALLLASIALQNKMPFVLVFCLLPLPVSLHRGHVCTLHHQGRILTQEWLRVAMPSKVSFLDLWKSEASLRISPFEVFPVCTLGIATLMDNWRRIVTVFILWTDCLLMSPPVCKWTMLWSVKLTHKLFLALSSLNHACKLPIVLIFVQLLEGTPHIFSWPYLSFSGTCWSSTHWFVWLTILVNQLRQSIVQFKPTFKGSLWHFASCRLVSLSSMRSWFRHGNSSFPWFRSLAFSDHPFGWPFGASPCRLFLAGLAFSFLINNFTFEHFKLVQASVIAH
jgi:hypothetical protein